MSVVIDASLQGQVDAQLLEQGAYSALDLLFYLGRHGALGLERDAAVLGARVYLPDRSSPRIAAGGGVSLLVWSDERRMRGEAGFAKTRRTRPSGAGSRRAMRLAWQVGSMRAASTNSTTGVMATMKNNSGSPRRTKSVNR